MGAGVSNFKTGDHVLISCISSCGRCDNCKKGMPSHCRNDGGWILGNLIDGTQAELVRIPQHHPHHAPGGTVTAGKVKPKQLITHRFTLSETMKAYDTFGNAMRDRALKVIIRND